MKVSLVSLGCPKNLVDSEGALGEIVEAGHEIVTDQSRADVIVVNTCGFIESAREESADAIREALAQKNTGNCRAVVVIGCLSQRFPMDPEVDVCLGVNHQGRIAEAIEQAISRADSSALRQAQDAGIGPDFKSGPNVESQWIEPRSRVLSTPPWTAYLKVSDGCSNRCAYCAIPDIRGPYRSRPEQLVIDEAKRLADGGVKEIVLVGQDLTQYGQEQRAESREQSTREPSLAGLVERLNEIGGLRWIRLMYCYPSKVTPELIDVIAGCEKVVKYVDLPLQHGDDDMLRAMNRRGTVSDYLRVIDDLRAKCPEIALRSTFIVGFPGETEVGFENLLRFVERIRFDRVGAFVYSREEGTPAALLFGADFKSAPNKRPVPGKIAEKRLHRLMRLQQGISLERNQSFVGSRMEVLVEGVGRLEGSKVGTFGRSYRDAPEIDGLVYLPGSTAEPGTFVETTITEATEYDLIGEKVGKSKGQKVKKSKGAGDVLTF